MRSFSRRLEATVCSRLLLVSALTGALVACNQGGLKGSGNLKTDTRAVSGFSEITLASMGDVSLAQTGTESLTIEAEDNLLPHLRSAVSGGRLTLDTDTSLLPTKPVHYTITVKDLTGVDVSGAGKLTGTQLHASAIRIRISGAGNVSLSGEAEAEDISLSGAGNYDGEKLATKTARVVVDGVGKAVVHAADAVDAKISGVGNVDYIGDPKVTQSVSGVGAVRKR